MSVVTLQQLKKVLRISERIKELETELASTLGIREPAQRPVYTPIIESTRKSVRKTKRALSPSRRAAIIAAQKAHQAKFLGKSSKK